MAQHNKSIFLFNFNVPLMLPFKPVLAMYMQCLRKRRLKLWNCGWSGSQEKHDPQNAPGCSQQISNKGPK